MFILIRSILLGLLISFSAVNANPNLINAHVKRTIDITTSVAISKTSIRMRNDGTEPASFFYFSVKCTDAAGMSDLWAIPTGPIKTQKALKIEPTDDVPGLDSCCSGFKIYFPNPLESEEETTIDVRMDVSGVIKSVPDVLQEHDKHYTRFEGNAYFYTPYQTESMETVLMLSSSQVTSKHGIPEPSKMKGKKMTLGPYENIEPFSKADIALRFYNGHGLIVAHRAVKEYIVSHWGTISTTEEFEIENKAAKHDGEWSRVDHQGIYKSQYDTAVDDVWANLPGDATKIYYEDLVGNVTTSRLRSPSGNKRAVQLRFRYPLMGGWRNHFWVTYDLMLGKHGTSSGSQHELKIPIFPSLNTDLRCEELVIRVLLPEWAYGIELEKHPSLTFEEEFSSERTSFTIFGRPVQTLRLKQIRSQSKHAKKITIKYKYNTGLAWVTPIIVSIQVFTLLAICLLVTGQGYMSLEDGTDEKIKSM